VYSVTADISMNNVDKCLFNYDIMFAVVQKEVFTFLCSHFSRKWMSAGRP
jgi:hypothetical protein